MGGRSTSSGHRLGLRKGAWTAEEDELLRNCMEKYGAVKWNLVPERAGLNRCRKSCRLRWLNYLCPSIKRGKFEDDEVDLIVRLHKLLGNRWSLIAGRIPGRTANDVKNYWNTHLSKQMLVEKVQNRATATRVELIKPQPQSIPQNWRWLKDVEVSPGEHNQQETIAPKQPSTCDSNINALNFTMSDVEIGKSLDAQTKFLFEDGFQDSEFLLEDLNPDFNLWSDFGAI